MSFLDDANKIIGTAQNIKNLFSNYPAPGYGQNHAPFGMFRKPDDTDYEGSVGEKSQNNLFSYLMR